MSVFASIARRLFVVSAMLLLAACGGGGGGGGSGGGGSAYSLSTNSVSFTATQNGATPQSQQVPLTVNSGMVYIALTTNGSGFTASFQVTGQTTGTITITPDAPTMSPGTYGGTVSVRGCSTLNCTGPDVAGSPQTINVTYTISVPPTVSVAPAAVSHWLGAGVVSPARTVTISSNTGSVAWTSSITYTSGTAGWLSISPNSGGTLPATISVSANAMPAGTYKANVAFSAGGASTLLPVTLVVKSAQVTFVSPYVATTNVGGDVVVRGYGFSSLSNPAVLFGSTVATAVNVVNDTEIRATHPALAQGSYTVTVQDASQTLPTRARLAVVDVPSLVYAAIPRPTSASSGLASQNLVYDAERRAIYVCDINLNVGTGQYTDRLERYRFNGSGWTTDPVMAFTSFHNLNSRIALAPDGTEILKVNYTTMVHVDPVNWLVTASTSVGSSVGTAATLNVIGMANDGGVIGNASPQGTPSVIYRYDQLDRIFVPLGVPTGLTQAINRMFKPSGDGSRLLAPYFGYSITGEPLYYYDSGSYSFVDAGISSAYTSSASVDRTASRAILQGSGGAYTVYDASFNALGMLSGLNAMVISPNGSSVYTFVGASNTIRKFDLTTPDGSGGFTEVGTGTSIPDSPGTGVTMTISPDGGTLILAGSQRVVVMPAP